MVYKWLGIAEGKAMLLGIWQSLRAQRNFAVVLATKSEISSVFIDGFSGSVSPFLVSKSWKSLQAVIVRFQDFKLFCNCNTNWHSVWKTRAWRKWYGITNCTYSMITITKTRVFVILWWEGTSSSCGAADGHLKHWIVKTTNLI